MDECVYENVLKCSGSLDIYDVNAGIRGDYA